MNTTQTSRKRTLAALTAVVIAALATVVVPLLSPARSRTVSDLRP